MYSSVSISKNTTFQITSFDPTGNPVIVGPNVNQAVPWSIIFDSNGYNVDPSQWRLLLNMPMVHDPRANTLHLKSQVPVPVQVTTSAPVQFQVYKNQNSVQNRVKFSETNLPQHPSFSDYFISNSFYCSKEKAILLGHLEALVRCSCNSDLVSKIFPELVLSSQTHFRSIFEFLGSNKPNDKAMLSKRLFELQEIDLSKPSSVQKLADKYLVGIGITTLIDQKNFEKFMILPEFADFAPIPLMQLLVYEGFVFTLYSSQQNGIDGFNESGSLESACQLGEDYPDSFYHINQKETLNEAYDLIAKSTEIIALTEPVSNQVPKISNLILTFLEGLEKLNKSAGPNASSIDLESCTKNIIALRTRAERMQSSVTSGFNPSAMLSGNTGVSSFNQYPPAAVTQNKQVVKTPIPKSSGSNLIQSPLVPTNIGRMPISINELPRSPLTTGVQNNNMISNSRAGVPGQYLNNLGVIPENQLYQVQKSVVGSNRVPQGNLKGTSPGSIYPSSSSNNPITQSPGYSASSSVRSFNPGVQSSSATNKPPVGYIDSSKKQAFSQFANSSASEQRVVEKCNGCNKQRGCIILHENCRMCDSCIFVSKTSCILCSKKLSESSVKAAQIRINPICDTCNQAKSPSNIIQTKCGCLVCKSCSTSRNRNQTACSNCGNRAY